MAPVVTRDADHIYTDGTIKNVPSVTRILGVLASGLRSTVQDERPSSCSTAWDLRPTMICSRLL